MIFSRRRAKSGRHARQDEPGRGAQSRPPRSRADAPDEPTEAASGPSGDAPPRVGPYDVTDDYPTANRVDLGSLAIPVLPGVDVRVQTNAEGLIQQVVLVSGESALQLGVFAAPRTERIWSEVRADLRRSLSADGVAAEEVAGAYGVELRARVRTADGPRDLRYVGVDGPRWLVQAVYQVPAGADDAATGPLDECLRGLVVDRGEGAKPVREPLPLRLPPEMAAQIPGAPTATGPAPAAAADAAPGAAAAPAGRPTRGRPAPVPGRATAAGPDGAGAAAPAAVPGRKPSPRPRRSP